MAKIRVPQKSGEIRVSRDGNDAVVYEVTNGSIEIDDADVDHFLKVVEGSELVASSVSSDDKSDAKSRK
jgi:DUF4097 and DUF4098 domain-containing protein YvlB